MQEEEEIEREREMSSAAWKEKKGAKYKRE